MLRCAFRRCSVLLDKAITLKTPDPWGLSGVKKQPKEVVPDDKIVKEEVTPLAKWLLDECRHNDQPMTVARWMKYCLLHPTLGYYARQSEKIGPKGDFITSPLISGTFFSSLMAVWITGAWTQMGKPPEFNLVEIGGGTGTMMADILTSWDEAGGPMGECSRACHLVMLEASKTLRAVQQDTIRKAVGIRQVDAIEDYTEIGVDRPTIIIAHEFFDALPISMCSMTDEGWGEVLVFPATKDENTPYNFKLVPHKTKMVEYLIPKEIRRGAAQGTIVETSVDTVQHFRKICEILETTKGMALIVDYGYDYGKYVPKTTWRGYRNHKLVEALSMPGETDITADVNFHVFRELLEHRGQTTHLMASPTITQRDFLLGLGADIQLIRQLKKADTEIEGRRVISLYKKLLGTGEGDMGRIYKAMAIAHKKHGLPLPFVGR
eukprot:TRINITY_DN63487_c0_g1_i1.p1 TRINITY_DN63487_c0_g1~~TRINITY_DN63487_c0_g1_i1.p1  ORF type:complete len:435 (-),score=35.16 TRINITY_DN63487_c0_g1_i1:94-1398(-)